MNKFSFKYYKKMLKKAISSGFVISSFEKFDNKKKKTIILRHDIDYSLKGITEFAKIENDLGVTSTYFFRVHSPNYNPFSQDCYNVFNYLKKLNHEIGLHFDSSYFSKIFKLDPISVFKKERIVLETIIGRKIKSISEHYDLYCNIFNIEKLENQIDVKKLKVKNYAYDKKFIHDMKYISDSNGNWRDGDIVNNLNFKRLQVLTHPELWFDSVQFVDYLTHQKNE